MKGGGQVSHPLQIVFEGEAGTKTAQAEAPVMTIERRAPAKEEAAPLPELHEDAEMKGKIVAAWKAYYTEDGGRFRGDFQSLKRHIRSALGTQTATIERHRFNEWLVLIDLQVREGFKSYGLPLSTVFNRTKESFDSDIPVGLLPIEISDLVAPAEFNKMGILIKKGAVKLV